MAEKTVLIVDDEPLARQRMRDLVGDIGGYVIMSEAGNGVEAMTQVQSSAIDIVLVDIRMPVMDGIEFAQHLRGLASPPGLIFTTAYDHYAVQAFDLNAVDYLLKPIRAERLAAALAKVQTKVQAQTQAFTAQQLQALQSLQSTHAHLSIHERGKVVLVPLVEVLYLHAELKYVTVRTRENTYLLEASLNQLEQTYGDHFVRVHRNALVARDAIAGFEKQRNEVVDTSAESSWVVQIKGIPDTLAVSRRHQHLIKAL